SHRFRGRGGLLEATTLARRPRRRDDAHHSPALFRALLRLPADLREQLVRLRAHQRRVAAALDVEPEQRLGIRGAQVETPVVELDADAVDVLDPLRTRRVLLLDAPHRRRGVFDAPVDLAARRKERHPFLDELGKLGAALAHDLREQQPRNHAAVGIRETAEIVMRAHLAAVDRVDLAHRLLDERMAGLALHGLAAGALDEIDRAPREPRIVHDRLAGILLEETHREEPDDVVALDERAFLVEEEAAVEVAVPCETEIRAGLADLLDRHDAVALDHRIRHAVRER